MRFLFGLAPYARATGRFLDVLRADWALGFSRGCAHTLISTFRIKHPMLNKDSKSRETFRDPSHLNVLNAANILGNLDGAFRTLENLQSLNTQTKYLPNHNPAPKAQLVFFAILGRYNKSLLGFCNVAWGDWSLGVSCCSVNRCLVSNLFARFSVWVREIPGELREFRPNETR